MKLSDLPLNPTGKMLRQFAGAWLVFFLAFGVHQYLVRGHKQLGVALGVMAVTIGVLGLVAPKAVKWIFVAWMVLAFPIGWLVSQLMLIIMFYGIIAPVAVLFRVKGRDVLNRRRVSDQASFWLPKKTPEDPRSYFRQY